MLSLRNGISCAPTQGIEHLPVRHALPSPLGRVFPILLKQLIARWSQFPVPHAIGTFAKLVAVSRAAAILTARELYAAALVRVVEDGDW